MIYHYISYAKVNLGLKVLNKRKDGYHNLHSLFVELDLSDKLIFNPTTDFQLSADCANNIQLPLNNTNLISQAYKLMHQEAGSVPSEYSIHLKKKNSSWLRARGWK